MSAVTLSRRGLAFAAVTYRRLSNPAGSRGPLEVRDPVRVVCFNQERKSLGAMFTEPHNVVLLDYTIAMFCFFGLAS